MFRPGEEPLESLASAFLDPNISDIQRGDDLKTARKLICDGDLECLISGIAKNNHRVVLLVDQFEEVFALCRDSAKRQQFFECLLKALPKCGMKICLILAMRADFFGKCAEQEYSGLSDHIRNNLVVVKPMNPEELRDAIVKPAKLAGAKVEPELVAQIVGDVEDSPGTLPLMQYALTELWKVRDDNFLKLTQYSRMGGVKGTLAKRADEIYGSFSEPEKDIARRIFIELTQLGEGTEDTRRQVRKDALISLPEKEELVNEVIRKLADEKLIVTSEAQEGDARQFAVVDVAHEALIRNWTRLRTWLDNSRDDIRFHRRLSAAAEYWERHGKAEGLLWRSPDLDSLKKFQQKADSDMTELQRQFFHASVHTEIRANRLKQIVITLLIFFAIVAGGAAYFANDSRKMANNEREKAQSLLAKNYWTLAVTAKENNDWLKSVHFWARTGKEDKAELLLKNCILNIQSHIPNIAISNMQHNSRIQGALFSKEAKQILTWGVDDTNKRASAWLWNAKDGSLAIQPMKHDTSAVPFVKGAAFSKDEQFILTWSGDLFNYISRNSDIVYLWNTRDGSLAINSIKNSGLVHSALFDEDEKQILILSFTINNIFTADNMYAADSGIINFWNISDGSLATPSIKHKGKFKGAEVSKSKQLILTWEIDGTIRLWSIKDGSSIGQPMKHEKSVKGALFSNEERLILSWSEDGTVRLWNANDGSPIGQPMKHEKSVNGAMFSKEERLILSWSEDGTARLWNAEDGSPVIKTTKLKNQMRDENDYTVQSMKHDKSVEGALLSKDEQLILTWSEDGTARLWNAKDYSAATQPMKHGQSIKRALFPKDNRIITWSNDGVVRTWNAKDGSTASLPIKHNDVMEVLLSKDERFMLTWSVDGTVWLWNTDYQDNIELFIKHGKSIKSAIFSKDNRIITLSNNTVKLRNAEDGTYETYPVKQDEAVNTVQLWNAEDRTLEAFPMKHDRYVGGAIFSTDGQFILKWGGNEVQLCNTNDGSLAIQPMTHVTVRGATFSNGGRLILTWSENEVQLWNAKDGSLATQFKTHEISVKGAVFSNDDRYILAWGNEGEPYNNSKKQMIGTAMIWNAKDGSPASQPIKHEGVIKGGAFSNDDQFVLTWGEIVSLLDKRNKTGTATIWNAKDGSSVIQPVKYLGTVEGAIFSKDGNLILTWGGSYLEHSGIARLWNAKNGSPVTTPMKHESVRGAVFSKNEQLILTWGEDGSARLWNAKDGSEAALSMRHDKSVNGAVFSKDESRILTWSKDGTARLWNIDADYDFPKEHLPLLVEVCTGTAMDDFGNVRALNKEEWETRKQEYIRISEEHLKTCKHKSANIYLNRQKPFWGNANQN